MDALNGFHMPMSRLDFEDLQAGRLHKLSGQLVTVLHHVHITELLPDVLVMPLVIHFVCVASYPSITKKAWLHPLCTLHLGVYTL